MLDTIISQKDYSYNEIVNILFALKEKYRFVEVFQIGKSVVGRGIYAVKIGMAKRQILYSGAIHGSERLTAAVLTLFLEQFSKALYNNADFALSSARNALFGKSLVIIPISNPDGYEIARGGAATAGAFADNVRRIAGSNELIYWNANVRGVDLNHNFNAGFDEIKKIERQNGILAPSTRRYGGKAAESEPESKALSDYCRNNFVSSLYCLHSQGEEIYWQYGKNTPKNALRLANLFAAASGYKVSQPEYGASFAGFKDWFTDEFSRCGFTLEIAKGKNPLPPDLLYDTYEKLEELLLLSVALG